VLCLRAIVCSENTMNFLEARNVCTLICAWVSALLCWTFVEYFYLAVHVLLSSRSFAFKPYRFPVRFIYRVPVMIFRVRNVHRYVRHDSRAKIYVSRALELSDIWFRRAEIPKSRTRYRTININCIVIDRQRI